MHGLGAGHGLAGLGRSVDALAGSLTLLTLTSRHYPKYEDEETAEEEEEAFQRNLAGALSCLSRLTALRSLGIDWGCMRRLEAVGATLRALTGLTRLALDNTPISLAEVEVLSSLPSLAEVTFSWAWADDSDAPDMAACPPCASVPRLHCGVTVPHLGGLMALFPAVAKAEVWVIGDADADEDEDEDEASREAPPPLAARWADLRDLDLSSNRAAPAFALLRSLAPLQLRRLKLTTRPYELELYDDALAALLQMAPHLERLSISSSALTQAAIVFFKFPQICFHFPRRAQKTHQKQT